MRRPEVKAAAALWLRDVQRAWAEGGTRALAAAPKTRTGALEAARTVLLEPGLVLQAYSHFALPTVSAYADAATEIHRRSGAQAFRKANPIIDQGLAWSRRNSARLITEISGATADTIADIVAQAYENGEAIHTIIRNLSMFNQVGLTSKLAQAVENLRAQLEAEGLGAAEIAQKVAAYSRDLLDYRLEMIARTEVAMAAMAGVVQAYGDNGVTSLLWVADPQCCLDCASQAWQEYSIEEADGLIPLHPNCECTFVTAAGWSGEPAWAHEGEPWPSQGID